MSTQMISNTLKRIDHNVIDVVSWLDMTAPWDTLDENGNETVMNGAQRPTGSISYQTCKDTRDSFTICYWLCVLLIGTFAVWYISVR